MLLDQDTRLSFLGPSSLPQVVCYLNGSRL